MVKFVDVMDPKCIELGTLSNYQLVLSAHHLGSIHLAWVLILSTLVDD